MLLNLLSEFIETLLKELCVEGLDFDAGRLVTNVFEQYEILCDNIMRLFGRLYKVVFTNEIQ